MFDGEGYLFIGTGEITNAPTARIWINCRGKVVRLTEDGEVPADNPFVHRAGARPEIWSYGIRNPQGMAMNPRSDTLWLNEHGPRSVADQYSAEGKNYRLAAGDAWRQLQRTGDHKRTRHGGRQRNRKRHFSSGNALRR